MALDASIPVRFASGIASRLKTVSEKTGISVSQLVRIATEQYLNQIESSRTISFSLGEFSESPPVPKKGKI